MKKNFIVTNFLNFRKSPYHKNFYGHKTFFSQTILGKSKMDIFKNVQKRGANNSFHFSENICNYLVSRLHFPFSFFLFIKSY